MLWWSTQRRELFGIYARASCLSDISNLRTICCNSRHFPRKECSASCTSSSQLFSLEQVLPSST
uniref:Venom peptide U1-SYTX-Sth1b n=1 Tax=Scytodes thoracica TaxID=1112478 RepID=A0A0A0V7I5_SCYTH|nr:venom peptide U1-SYTX-Sth1b [Scytodes thoracica]